MKSLPCPHPHLGRCLLHGPPGAGRVLAAIVLLALGGQLLFAGPALGQPQDVELQASGDPDEMFRRAREVGFAGDRERAREMGFRILEGSPGYHDVRIFVGRLYAWDGDYESARAQLGQVIDQRPGYTDARLAIIDVENWSKNYGKALQHCETGLDFEPGNAELLYRRATTLWYLDEMDAALAAYEELVELHPEDVRAQSALESARLSRMRYRASMSYSYERFNSFEDPWQFVTATLARQTSRGSIIGRVNFAHKFGSRAGQVEIDAYPRIAPGLYAFVNYGYSPTSFFPRHRGGVELYKSLGGGFEASLGAHHLRFTASDVTILTGSVGKYFGNYWLSVRPTVVPGEPGASVSARVTLRRYYASADHYISITAGGGSGATEIESTLDLLRLSHYSTGADWNKPLSPTIVLSIYGGFSSEELTFDRTRRRVNFGTGIRKVF